MNVAKPPAILTGEADIPAATRIVFGPSTAFSAVAQEMDSAGLKRAMIVTGNSLATKSDLITRLSASLGDKCVGVYSEMGEHSPRSKVVAAARMAKELGVDTLIGVGGGSSIVGTKGVALVVAEGEELDRIKTAYDYKTQTIDTPKLSGAKPAIIAIPTTLSAGEFSSAAGITNDTTGQKEKFIDPGIVPRLIVLDPVMTTATPPRLWASTGVKALQNAIERYYSRNRHPFIDGLCLEAIRIVFRYLQRSVSDPGDLDARGNLQFLNWMTAFGAGKGGIGLGHGICHQLGSYCHISHGISGCIVLPYMMEFNRSVTLPRQRDIAAAMGIDVSGLSDDDASKQAEQKVRELVRSLGLPARLQDAGVSESDLPRVAELTLLDRTLSPTPRPPRDAAEILTLLKLMY